jgi:acyl-[acyl carrier protein]--UDP-N-acetylglucosamine O-acyltransferase
MASGMMQILAPYIIRRGTGNELNDIYIISISRSPIKSIDIDFLFRNYKLGYTSISHES